LLQIQGIEKQPAAAFKGIGLPHQFTFLTKSKTSSKKDQNQAYKGKIAFLHMRDVAVFIAIVCLIEVGFIVQNLDKLFFQVLFMIFWLVNLGWVLFVLFAFYHLAKNIRAIEENIGIEKVKRIF